MRTIKLSALKSTVVVLLLTISLSACKKEPVEPPKNSCDHQGYFVKAHSFDGYYGEYAIRLDDGTILYPCIVESNTINKENIHEDMRVTVSYEPIINEEIACSIPYDPLFLPESKMYRARITCIGNEEIVECGTGFCGTGW